MKTTILDPKKAVGIAIIVAVVMLALYLIYRFLRKNIDRSKNDRNASAALKEEIKTGGHLTYGESTYTQLANKIHIAMKGWGTDEASIYSAFMQLKTKADVLKLIQAFGVRDKETLSEWLYDDLRASEIAKINNILSSKNIDYSF